MISQATQPQSLSFYLPQQIRHFWTRLRETPLLLGWLIVGPLFALALDGFAGLAMAALNIGMLGIYALIIRWLTPQAAPAVPIRRRSLELGLGLLFLAGFLVLQALEYTPAGNSPLGQTWRGFIAGIYNGVVQIGTPTAIVQDVFSSISSTIKETLPIILLSLALGYGLRAMGLRRASGRLIVVLIGLTVLLGLPFGVITRVPLQQALLAAFFSIFINALPEELVFRGFLLPRLEAILKNPLNALVLSAWLFNLSHVPIEIANGADAGTAIAQVFALTYPSGLLWGYLYLRTRSVIPGALWHAANVNLGTIFFNL